MRTIRILILDDHPLMRDGLAARISTESDMQVCGEAESLAQARSLIRSECPDVVVTDIQLPDGNGVELIKELRDRHSGAKILVVSAFDEAIYAERALRAGANGYINKRELQDTILDAIRIVASGKKFVSNAMTQFLLSQAIGDKKKEGGTPEERLSDRELEIFQLIGTGLTTGAIAKKLCLSVHTIDTHREKIRHKLGIKNGGELMRRAVQWCLEHGT